MRIALVHYSAPPVVGGVESVLGEHARLMANTGHQVSILAGRGGERSDKVKFVDIPLLNSRHSEILAIKAELDRGILPSQFEHQVNLISAALQSALRGVDILIAHNVCSLHKNLPLTAALHQLALLAQGPAIILWHHDLAWATPRYRKELHDGYPWCLLRQDWPRVAQVVVSELRQQELSALTGLPSERISVIPNGIDAARFLKLEPPTIEIVNRLRLMETSPLLLLPVRITPRKNIELAMRILAALHKWLPQAALLITGPLGPHNPANQVYWTELAAMRAELKLGRSVFFLAELVEGFLPDALVADFYRLSDALLLPSREEGFGIPILEAGLSGMPVFCADIPPLARLAGAHATFFSPDADPDAIAAKIAGHFQNSPTFNLRVRVRSEYLWERIYDQQIQPLLDRIRHRAYEKTVS